MAREKIIDSQQSKSLDTLMGGKEEKVSLSLLAGAERGPGNIYREEEGEYSKDYCLLQGMVGNRQAQCF